MLKQVKKAIKARLISFLRVRHKTPPVFDFTTEGERYTKHYPSVSYNVYIDEFNHEDYTYNALDRISHANHASGYVHGPNAVVSGIGAVQTRTFPKTDGRPSAVHTGYANVVMFPVEPFNMTLEITTRAKTDTDDEELCESILRNIGQYNTLVVSSWDGDRSNSLDMELDDTTDLTGLYRRLEGKQRLFERQFVYKVEGWLEGNQVTLSTVASRFYEEYHIEHYISSTGYHYTTSDSFIGTHSPDGV